MIKFPFIKTNRVSIFESLSGLEWNDVKTVLSGWKDGTRGYLTLHKERLPKSLEQLGYYYGRILPDAVTAFEQNQDFSLVVEHKGKRIEMELNLANMDLFLKTRYAAKTGKYVTKGEMDMAECSAFENWAIGWIAQWLDFQIPPADKNWRNNA